MSYTEELFIKHAIHAGKITKIKYPAVLTDILDQGYVLCTIVFCIIYIPLHSSLVLG